MTNIQKSFAFLYINNETLEKTVIAMYTCKDNLTPLWYSGKVKKIKKKIKKKRKRIQKYLLKLYPQKSNTWENT